MSEPPAPRGQRLVTPYAFIDTEAFRAAGLDWQSRTWSSLIDLASKSTLEPITTSITTREVEARLSEALAEAEAAAKKHGAIFGQLGESGPFGDTDPADRKALLHARFREFLATAKFTEIPLVADHKAIFDDYFAGAAPFGEGKKKSEFPDAFVLSSLLAWIRPGRPRIYVVGKDPDLVKFCEGRDDLIQLDSVAQLLSLALASAQLVKRLEAHVRGDASLLERLRARLNSYRPRRVDIEVEDVEFFDLEISSVFLVDESEEGQDFVLEVEVLAEVEADVRETGHEYVISRRGEPDLDIRTYHARPTSSAVIYVEVLVSEDDSGEEPALVTTDWAITSGDIEIKLPSQFSRREITLEAR